MAMNSRWIEKLFSIASACAVSIFLLCGFDGGCSFWNCPAGQNCNAGAPATVQNFQSRNTTVLQANGELIGEMPRPYQPIKGYWQYNLGNPSPIGNVTSFGKPFDYPGVEYAAETDGTGSYTVDNLQQNAVWQAGINFIGNCFTSAAHIKELHQYPWVYPNTEQINFQNPTIDFDCPSYSYVGVPAISPQFALNTSLPSSLDVPSDVPLSSTYGAPQLLVYNRTGGVVATESASSIDSSGMSAIFPYPSTSSGALAPDMYGTAIVNVNADGTKTYAGGGSFFTIGNDDTSYPDAFGVAAAEITARVTVCLSLPTSPTTSPTTSCSTTLNQNHYPVVTLANSSAVLLNGATVQVGANPVAVATYGVGSQSFSYPCGYPCISSSAEISGTTNAITINSGSNTVSLLDLITPGVIATLNVGSNPTAVGISPDQSTAYVANYGSGSITAVNLTNRSIIGSYPVGDNPDSVNVDASGNIWVGGNGYINKVSPSTYQILQTIPVSGIVTSLAVSSAQGKLVTTVVPSANTGTLAMQSYSTSGGQPTYSNTIGTTSAYVASRIAGHLSTPVQLGTGTLVSANYGNDLAVSASPGGFVVTEVSTGETVMTGSTPYPIRSIAVDPNYGEVYLTIPDSNTVITVPLPPIPTS